MKVIALFLIAIATANAQCNVAEAAAKIPACAVSISIIKGVTNF